VDEDEVLDPYERSSFAWEPFCGWQWAGDGGAHCPKCDHVATADAFHDPESC
jgi:hypothetical protein